MARKSRREKNAPQIAEQDNIIIKKKENLLATGAYGRLSVENGGNEDDETLRTQMAMLHSFIADHPDLELIDSYVDNGYSGTNFDRPEFIRLMDDVRSGKINCIVVKDLSRFGRDYLETGYYLETLFPHLNVRFIAVTDHFDSSRPEDRDSLAVPLKNMVNAMYAKDISKKLSTAAKIRAKRPDAMPMGTAPYGYLFSEDKSQYLEDPETAHYVRMIFRWAANGIDVRKITERLTLIGAITPGQNRLRTDDLPVVAKPWRPDMVYKILKHPVYTGNIHLGRTQQALYKSQPRRFTSLEEQTIRENTHIPLVTLEDYQSVQDAMYDNPRWAMRRNKKNLEERERLQDSLPGMVYCADCGKQMYFRRGSHDWQKGKRDGKEKVLTCYACEKRHKNSMSCGQVVYEDFLQIVAMDQVQFLIQNLADQTALLRKLSKANGGRHPLISIDRKIASLNGKIKDNGDKATKLYMSYADGIIPAEDYVTLKAQYSAVSEQLQKELCALEQRREMTEKILNKHKELADSLSGYSKSREFDARLVQQLIERISVSKNGNMEIRFKCADVVHETMKLIEGCDKE